MNEKSKDEYYTCGVCYAHDSTVELSKDWATRKLTGEKDVKLLCSECRELQKEYKSSYLKEKVERIIKISVWVVSFAVLLVKWSGTMNISAWWAIALPGAFYFVFILSIVMQFLLNLFIVVLLSLIHI